MRAVRACAQALLADRQAEHPARRLPRHAKTPSEIMKSLGPEIAKSTSQNPGHQEEIDHGKDLPLLQIGALSSLLLAVCGSADDFDVTSLPVASEDDKSDACRQRAR